MVSVGGVFWRKKARSVVRWVNLFWWVDTTIPLWLGLNLFSVCAVLIARRWLDLGVWFWLFYLVAIFAISLTGYFRSRGRFIGVEKGISRLDRFFDLQGALCSASQGVAPWPALPDRSGKPFEVGYNRFHASFLLSFGVLAGALLWPIDRVGNDPRLAIVNGPQAWADMENWLNVLDASELVDEESLDRFEDKLDELQSQSKEDWYSDGSLEATDFLKTQSEEATLQFLESLEMAIQGASRYSGSTLNGPEGQDGQDLGQSLENLDMGTLALKEDLMKKLSELASNDASGVDQESLKEMLDRMQEGAETVSKGLGIPRMDLQPMQAGAGQQGEEGEGGGPTPLTISNAASPEIAGALEGISNDDRERAILGDTTFTSEVRIEGFEPTSKGPQIGNRTHNVGEGGSAVWKTRARPKEQTLLKNYFSNE